MNLLDTVAVISCSFSKNEDIVNALKAKLSRVTCNDPEAIHSLNYQIFLESHTDPVLRMRA